MRVCSLCVCLFVTMRVCLLAWWIASSLACSFPFLAHMACLFARLRSSLFVGLIRFARSFVCVFVGSFVCSVVRLAACLFVCLWCEFVCLCFV